MRRAVRLMLVPAMVAGLLIGGASIASASEPFLCPVVGEGVVHADDVNNDNGVSDIDPAVGTSLLPGQNQAGANANDTAYNEFGPGNPDAGPGGGNSTFSPIWPHG